MQENYSPYLKKISVELSQIFDVLIVNDSHFYPLWHYHPQYEIISIKKSIGNRYVGDSVSTFSEGDILIFGPNIPHLLRNYQEYFVKNSRRKAKATVIYFSTEFMNLDFFSIKELTPIKKMLKLSERGLLIQRPHSMKVSSMLDHLTRKEGLDRVLDFIKMLDFIAIKAEYKILSSAGFSTPIDEFEIRRINRVFDYLFKNFSRNISLCEISGLANMSPSSFCRYFRKVTNKSLICFLNEIRVGHACKLLMENSSKSITQICFESGFNNITNFYIQFKKIKNLSPLEFHNKYSKLAMRD